MNKYDFIIIVSHFILFRLQEKPQLGFCSSDETTAETNSNVIEVESESPTEPLDRLDEALVTSSQSAVVDTTESNDHAVSLNFF